MTDVVLVPGAWSDGSVWDAVAPRLRESGRAVDAVTLPGLEPGLPDHERARVGLADHVDALADQVRETAGARGVVLVAHSYSSLVCGQVADRLGPRVAGLVHLGGFLPQDGRSLLDDWGSGPQERREEADQIRRDGMLWAAPTAEMLTGMPGLGATDPSALATSLRPHPGRTVVEPAVMTAPVTEQPTTYVALSPDGEQDAWQEAPEPARLAPGWRRRYLASGHWPMLSHADDLVDLLEAEVSGYLS